MRAPSSRARSPRWLWRGKAPAKRRTAKDGCAAKFRERQARCGLLGAAPEKSAAGTSVRLRSGQQVHAGATGRAGLHGELCLENLFEQIALIDVGGRAHT